MTIISEAEAARSTLASEPLSMVFGNGTDGSELVVRFLEAAKQRGATSVSGIAIHIATDDRGTPVECTTHIAPRQDIEARMESRSTMGRRESRLVLRPVMRTVTEHQRECRMVSRPVTTTQIVHTTRYDSMSGGTRSVPQSRTVTTFRSEQECRMVPRTRTVTRMKHHWQTRYIPPWTQQLSRAYSRWELIESKPSCKRGHDATPDSRIEGIIHVPAREPASS